MTAVRAYAARGAEPSAGVVAITLAGVAIAGLAVAYAPVLALAALLLGAFVAVTVAYTEATTLGVIFLIFANIPAVAVTQYGAPRSAAAAVPLLLAVPLGAHVLRGRRMIATPTLLLVVALFVVSVASTAFSAYQDVAADKLLTFGIEGVLLYLLVVNVVRSPAELRHAMWVVLAAGAFLAAMTVYQKLAVGFYRPLGGFGKVDPSYLLGKVDVPRAAGPVGDPNYYAQILIVATTIGLTFLRTERDLLLRLAAGGATLLVAYGMLLTYSRGAGIALAIVVLLLFAMRYYSARHLIAIVLGVAALLTAMPEYGDRLASLASLKSATAEQGTDPEAEISARSRTTEMLAAAYTFADHPVLGVGPDVFPRYYQEYANRIGIEVRDTALWGERAGQEAQRQSHNMFLSIAADLGLPGLLCFCGVIVVTLRGLHRVRRRALIARRPDIAHLVAGMLLAITAYVVCGMFLTLAFERYFWLLLALGGAAVVIARQEATPSFAARYRTNGATGRRGSGYRGSMATRKRNLAMLGRPSTDPTFELARFEWATPDTLELSGTFEGLHETPSGAPVLTLVGADRTHRLPAVPDTGYDRLRDGRPWHAAFAWQEPPAAFHAARLEWGPDFVVELPYPDDDRGSSRPRLLQVRRRPDGKGSARREPAPNLPAASDLEAEHERHVSDAERLHEKLTQVQQVAQEAIAAEESAVEQLRDDLRNARLAIEARDAALAEAEDETQQLRMELDTVREQADRARTEQLESARDTVQAARAEAERVLNRLASISDALEEGEGGSGAGDRPSAP